MTEIYAVIRPGKDRETKQALSKLGCMAMTSVRVLGRGRQRGLRYSVATQTEIPQFVIMKYLPKKMIYIVVSDRLVKTVVQALIRINQTGQHGDGKIFVSKVLESTRIRTGESGEDTLQ